ncbi:fluoride efflux transporter CrcB [Kosmotoga sp. DU53]|uniref:fluoride efflux transporter CrcB n=1 Tax=Kosmotoga sp. DU53 TaxID=1310160 RepID=UPI0007C4F6B7|nr:fluoride efflux transporter CrcB [Kosmotoga sp. DU53]OAA19987.1 chromosome condensation protein CrcB [Kosmotoga sp. DU53]
MSKFILIGAGGAAGAISRYLLSKAVNSLAPIGLIPWGTVLVNVIGSFLLAFLMISSAQRVSIDPRYIYLVGTGFLGAFTTFSTFSYEFITLISKSSFRGALYFLLTISLSVMAAYFGFILGRGR